MTGHAELPVESRLVRALLAGQFAVTAEIVPPLAGSSKQLLKQADVLKDHVDAVNLADSAGGKIHMAGLACVALLKQHDIEPVFQMTCRDRNRLALYSELLGAGALGIHNLLIMRGDDLDSKTNPQTKPVHDFTSADLIAAAQHLRKTGIVSPGSAQFTSEGIVPADQLIADPPNFFIGGADVPSGASEEWWAPALKKKVQAGARFVQTQLCYDTHTITRYAQALEESGLSNNLFVLVGTGPLASARSARWIRDNLWGVEMPDDVIARLESASDTRAEGIRICAEILNHIAETPGLAGAHLMAPGNLDAIPDAIATAGPGLDRSRTA